MKQLFKIAATPAAAAFALAWLAMATPAAASPGEYCRREYGSGTLRTCPYSTMEQCQDSVSGRTGSCERNPFMPDNSNAFAYQPKHGRAISVKKPVGSQ